MGGNSYSGIKRGSLQEQTVVKARSRCEGTGAGGRGKRGERGSKGGVMPADGWRAALSPAEGEEGMARSCGCLDRSFSHRVYDGQGDGPSGTREKISYLHNGLHEKPYRPPSKQGHEEEIPGWNR